MLIFRKVSDICPWLDDQMKRDHSVGFIPTMGALHAGHVSLIQASKTANNNHGGGVTICSIFINPTQFNDPKDLEKYPRTFDADCKLLTEASCDVLFYPAVSEIYPPNLKEIKVDLEGLDQILEGEHRPGHFKGVVQVVHRLLDIIKPHYLYMGQKDFQQFTIIRHMIKNFNMLTQLVVCPIAREPHGLAMSSRNVRLSDTGRMLAGMIYSILQKGLALRNVKNPQCVCDFCFESLTVEPFKVEYVLIVDTRHLKTISNWSDSGEKVICIAVWLEGVRLIDNIVFQ